MPKPIKPELKLVYPFGVRPITDNLSTDDLVRRLKECAQAFQNMSQEADNTNYIPLALHLASAHFIEHPSRDVRLLIACCVADVFRVFAPDAPYKDPDHLKVLFEFFIDQLRGLEDPKDPVFKRYFYLLENLAWVKTFNICFELEESQMIFCQLFALMFNIINDNHSPKVKNFMLDMMCPLIIEADSVSQELLDVIFAQVIEPRKSQNKNAYNLAKDILKKTSSTLEPYIQAFFSNTLILNKKSKTNISGHLYDLIYELNTICPTMMASVLPQLEFKLKGSDEKARLDSTKLLARMFSDKNSELALENKSLWKCFLGRFNDISVQVRVRCVQYSMHFLLNHPELRDDITEQLRLRQHDPEEVVRYEVVMAIISAAKKDFNSVSDELLTFVKERTLDKKFKIRKEALLGLATLYKQHMSSPDLPQSTRDCIAWIKNKVLHVYYQTALEDRLLVERILHTCLVPYQSPLEERVKKLYQLFVMVDDYAAKAFNELLRSQNMVRNQVRSILDMLTTSKSDERDKLIVNKVLGLSKNLLEPIKAQEYILKFCNLLENNSRVRSHMDAIFRGCVSCSDAEYSVKEVLKSLGLPVHTNSFYMTIKHLLERVAPVMVDHDGIKMLLRYVKDSLVGIGEIDAELGLISSAVKGLQLLLILSGVFPETFHGEEVYEELMNFLRSEDETAADLTLQIFTNIGSEIENNHPNFSARLLPLLQNFAENGTVKQAKHAVACLNVVTSNKERVFGHVIDHLKQHLSLDSQFFRTAVVSIGHIAYYCPDLFGLQIKSIVSKIIVKDLLMADQEDPRSSESNWGTHDFLPEETKVKIEGMKLIVRWLLGLKTATHSAMSTLRLLSTVINHHGDLMEKEHVSPMEKSWLRLTAAACMLKLCQEPSYAETITLEQFLVLAAVLNDECRQVREKFAQKLHKGLVSLKLPLDFVAIFALGGNEKSRELRAQLKQYLLANITKRREYLKQHPITTDKMLTLLPDYVLPYAIHMLAHDPSFKKFDDVPVLLKLKDCLWFLMEPLMTKDENYSFSFFKRLIENIKQTKDKHAPDDDLVNLRLYAVCDLALGLVMSKTTNFVLKDFPVEPILPSKLFTEPDKNYNNTKTYLPPELIYRPPKKSGIEMEVFAPLVKNQQSSDNAVQDDDINETLDNNYQKEETIENIVEELNQGYDKIGESFTNPDLEDQQDINSERTNGRTILNQETDHSNSASEKDNSETSLMSRHSTKFSGMTSGSKNNLEDEENRSRKRSANELNSEIFNQPKTIKLSSPCSSLKTSPVTMNTNEGDSETT